MQGAAIRKMLRTGQRVYGTHVVGFGTPTSAQITATIQMDFVFICTEHIPIDRTEVGMMCQFYAARGICPIVRIAYPCPRLASMYLDAGAHGIVAPYVETIEEVQALVGAVRYRPIKGEFLRQLLSGERTPQPEMKLFFERFNQDTFLIIGVESIAAVKRLETLISDDGVDGVFLGPHDLTCSMEIPEQYAHPEFVTLVTDVISRCRRAGKGVGIHMDLAAQGSQPYHQAGINFMLNLADVVKVRNVLNADFAQLRSQYGDVYQTEVSVASGSTVCVDIKQNSPN